MLILIEGPDGAGKTTLAHALVDRLGADGDAVELHHAGPPIGEPLDEYERPLYGYRPASGRHVVCDRWHVGEVIYPEVVRRPTRYDAAKHLHVELFLRSRGALLVYVDAADDRIRRGVLDRGETDVAADRAVAAARAYRRYFKSGPYPSVIPYPYVLPTLFVATTDSPKTFRSALDGTVQSATALEHSAARLAPFVTYVGTSHPRLLLVGDVRGVDGRHAIGDAPAFVPYAGTSGHYLASTLLETVHHTQASLGIVNACDVDDVRSVVDVVTRSRPCDVVALGVNATRRLAVLGVDHRTVAHPQYVRRFYHHDRAAYARHIFDGQAPSWWRRSA